MSVPAERAERLRALHREGGFLFLPNAWDIPSARLVAELGFPVIATSSAAIASVHGMGDGEEIGAERMLAAIGAIAAAVELPVTADLESGYGLPPRELAERLLEAGAVGLNLEDTDHGAGKELRPAQEQAERIAEIKEAGRDLGVDLVLNARIDVFVREAGEPESRVDMALERAALYREAGADCLYPIAVKDESAIERLVDGIDGPVNVLVLPGGPSLARLRELGVRRASLGSGLFHVAEAGLRRFLGRVEAEPETPVYRSPG